VSIRIALHSAQALIQQVEATILMAKIPNSLANKYIVTLLISLLVLLIAPYADT